MGLIGKLKERKALRIKMIEAQTLQEFKEMQFRHNETLYNSYLNQSEEFMRLTNMKAGQKHTYQVGDKYLTDYVTKLGVFKTSATPFGKYDFTYTYEGLIENADAKKGFDYVRISKTEAENNITVGYYKYKCVAGNPYDGFKNIDIDGRENEIDMKEVGFVDDLIAKINKQILVCKEVDSEKEAE